jgi:cytochrome c biogenesis protein CcdA
MLLTFIVVWVICGIVAAMIGQSKNLNVGTSFVLGIVLGVFGVAIVALMHPGAPAGLHAAKCPRCNAVQNVSNGQSSFECWQCKYVAHALNPQ